MSSVHDFKVVPATGPQLKKIEKVFIDAGVPYFTNGKLSWDTITPGTVYKRIADGKYYVSASGIIDHAQDNNLVQALKDAFSGTDLIAWFKANKTHKNNVFDNPTT
tara:strand:- start:15775 stop:16092 length:318 start_codon:yes stop_codon:yes gene_type:complete